MIFLLDTAKLRDGLYQGRLLFDGTEVVETSTQATLADVLSDVAGRAPRALARYIEVRYAGVCLGTQPFAQLGADPLGLARSLQALAGQVWTDEVRHGASITPKI